MYDLVLSHIKVENSLKDKLCLDHFAALNNKGKDVKYMFKLYLMESAF